MIDTEYDLRNSINKTHIINDFLKIPAHSWILNNPQYKSIFIILLSSLSQNHFYYFFKNKEDNLIFLKSEGRYCGAISVTTNQNLILIYPDFLQLMKNQSMKQAIGILAHELGHLYLGHNHNIKDSLSNQVEADYFSYELGHGKYLLEFLKSQNQSKEVILRITQLESYLKVYS